MFREWIFSLIVASCTKGALSIIKIPPCKIEDQACIQNSVNVIATKIIQGIPELGVETSDPLFFETIEGNLSILKYKFFNTTITGYKDCTVSNLKVSPDLTSLYYELNCPRLKLNGKYDITGRLIILPVEGNGDYEVITGKYSILVDSELKVQRGSDGKSYLSIKNFKLKCNPLSAPHFDFKNLFHGQKDFSDAVHKFAHENWPEVADLVQDPVFYPIVNSVIKNVNKFLKTVPLDDFKLN
ncbi:circadian clock-controlled protein daywake-like isoform X3 [Maniola jurtina]|uniref:circadian clock-controlled protein daywake-like isoform X3 n=1 Tax=Maniola jurtina TaxID=191418 RepID=UPI001E68C3EF|nr:circadian clock-controlled protein daywake-like isoform X3 [Maniola jurtina]